MQTIFRSAGVPIFLAMIGKPIEFPVPSRGHKAPEIWFNLKCSNDPSVLWGLEDLRGGWSKSCLLGRDRRAFHLAHPTVGAAGTLGLGEENT